MGFVNILSDDSSSESKPQYFKDLGLNQIVEDICRGRQEYSLQSYYFQRLKNLNDIQYRQEIFKDLDDLSLLKAVNNFSNSMKQIYEKESRIKKLYNEWQKKWYRLDTMELYMNSLSDFLNILITCGIKSQGLICVKKHITVIVEGDHFLKMKQMLNELKDLLSSVTFRIRIYRNMVEVSDCIDCAEYAKEVEKTFSIFKQGDVQDQLYRKFSSGEQLNTVEERILECVVKLNASIFDKLNNFVLEYDDYLDRGVADFYHKIQFYLSYLEYIQPLQKADLPFCYPVFNESRQISISSAYDIGLAHKGNQPNVIANDFSRNLSEQIFVITGANQGGKTTYARMLGQIFHLSQLGVPVPGSAVSIYLADAIFTHFEREEAIKTEVGKLQDDLERLYPILQEATEKSIIILNEIFSSTTLQDALFLGRKMIDKMIGKGSLCIYVTFLDELSQINEQTVSIVSTVDKEKRRTYKLMRQKADGMAYAYALAEKYDLTYKQIKERMNNESLPVV